MTARKLGIMVAACRLRMAAGKKLEEILAAWPALDEEDKEQIRMAVDPQGDA